MHMATDFSGRASRNPYRSGMLGLSIITKIKTVLMYDLTIIGFIFLNTE